MADVYQLTEAVQNNLSTIKAALGDDWPEFDKQYVAILDSALLPGDGQGRRQGAEQLSALLTTYPAAVEALPEGTRKLLGNAETDAGRSAETPAIPEATGSISRPSPPPVDASSPAADVDGRIADNRTPVPTTSNNQEARMATQLPGTQTQQSSTEGGRSTEQEMQVFKERVTAIIGLALVTLTVVTFLYMVFAILGNSNQLAAAKDIMTMILPLTGVVLGYYFGRVPADARAAQSQEKADNATAQAEHVKTEAGHVAEVLDNMAADQAVQDGDGSRSLEAIQTQQVQSAAQIRDLSRQLRSISNMR